MKSELLKQLVLECINEVLLERKSKAEKKEAPKAEAPKDKKKETPKAEKKVDSEPKKSKGDAVARPKPHEKAFNDMTQNLTKKYGKVKGKEMLSKKVKSLDEDNSNKSFKVPNTPLEVYRNGSHYSIENSNTKTKVEVAGAEIPALIKVLEMVHRVYDKPNFGN